MTAKTEANRSGVTEIQIGGSVPGRISPKEMTELELSLRQLASDDDTRVVVLRGPSGHFCEGDVEGDWHPHYARRLLPIDGHSPAPVPHQELVKALFELEKPTVALIDGDCQGFGLDLACACDLRIAASEVSIGDGRLYNTGEWSDTGITYLLPRLIGLSRAQQLLLLGERWTAQDALAAGFLYAVHDRENLEAGSAQLLERLAGMATRSYGMIKQQIVAQLALPFDIALMHSLAVRQTNIIEDRNEADEAFRASRPEHYTGL